MSVEKQFTPLYAHAAVGNEAEDRLNMAFPDLSFRKEKDMAKQAGLAVALGVGTIAISGCAGSGGGWIY